MALLAVKVFMGPAFVLVVSLVARRAGSSLAGVVGSLPVVAGPILFVYALAHGDAFAARAAAGTLLGLLSLTAFVIVFGLLAGFAGWLRCLIAGLAAFAAATVGLADITVPAGVALVADSSAFAVGFIILGRRQHTQRVVLGLPRWDLSVRALCAVLLVMTLTAVSGWLGPRLSGLLTSFPVMTTILASFTLARQGAAETVQLLRGMLAGFVGVALFCLTLTILLPRLAVGIAFSLATVATVLAQGMVFFVVRRRLADDAGSAQITSLR